jgi:hypothetical protein
MPSKQPTTTLRLSYQETVDYFKSAVSYLPILKESDKRQTTQWIHVDRELLKNLERFYNEFVLIQGTDEDKKYFKDVIENYKKESRKAKTPKGEKQG